MQRVDMIICADQVVAAIDARKQPDGVAWHNAAPWPAPSWAMLLWKAYVNRQEDKLRNGIA